jgi:hypothetical protein
MFRLLPFVLYSTTMDETRCRRVSISFFLYCFFHHTRPETRLGPWFSIFWFFLVLFFTTLLICIYRFYYYYKKFLHATTFQRVQPSPNEDEHKDENGTSSRRVFTCLEPGKFFISFFILLTVIYRLCTATRDTSRHVSCLPHSSTTQQTTNRLQRPWKGHRAGRERAEMRGKGASFVP